MSDENKESETPAEEAPPTNTVTLTIDGQEVTVAKGTNLLEAARSIGTEITAFCYHPGLPIAACCRQCLVTIEGWPKLQPSCHVQAADEMVVLTKDEASTAARQKMLEFTLLNHPVDCPICDKAGECTLQKHYFNGNNLPSRSDVVKVNKPKVVDLGPTIIHDADRCILCSRCIRVCDEVAGQHQLEFRNRGDHEILGVAPGAVLDHPYSLNTVDVCPVGALTAKDFRFAMRAWELWATPSVCNGCATGCNLEINHKDDQVYRLRPRCNPEVNKYWMCDEGRMTYKAQRNNRLAVPAVEGLPSSWDRALAAAAAKLLPIIEADPSSVGVVFSAQHSNEANYALAKLARDIWQLERFYLGGKAPVPERADKILRDADVNPNSAGLKALLNPAPAGLSVLDDDVRSGDLKALLVLGQDLPMSEEAIIAAASLDALIVISTHDVGIAQHAYVALPAATWIETNGTITNRQGLVQRMHAAFPPPGQALPAWEAVTKLGKACNAALKYTNPKELFQEMVGATEAFKDADWGKEALPVQLRFAGSRG